MALNHLPHITNVAAGVNKWDPVHNSIFEVYMTFPTAISDVVTNDDAIILSQQVLSVDGLDALQRVPEAGSQKFYGVDVSYLNPVLDKTRAEFSMKLNMNLRNVTDNYVLKAFKAWSKISYDLATGARTLKSAYCADNFRIAQANRDGSVWRAIVFHDVMMTSLESDGLSSLAYDSKDAKQLTVKFVADYWDEDIA